tara:strand:- start:197535 stop:198788 length:1254 start_codon:yes stop_codon:yes gene_type:complete
MRLGIKPIKGRLDLRGKSLLLLALFPIFKFNVASMAIITIVVGSAYEFIIKKEKFDREMIKYFILNSLFLLLLLFSLLYSSNISYGLKTTQNTLSLIILPFVLFFLFDTISSNMVQRTLWAFTSACLVLTFYIYFEIFVSGVFTNITEFKFWKNPFRDVLFNLRFIDLHPSYYTIWILFSILFLVSELFQKKSFWAKAIMMMMILFFLASAYLFSARAPLLGFVIALLFQLIFQLPTARKRIYFTIFILLLATISVTQVSMLKTRFVDEFKAQEFRPPVGQAHTSTNIRIGIYMCVFEIFRKNIWFGVGVGDVKDELDLCFEQYHTRVYDTGYNTHSSYFNLLLSGGIVSLALFIGVMFYQYFLAIQHKNYLYLSFLILMSVVFLFENVLARMHGALFYGLFNSLFIKQILSEAEKK